MSATRRRDDGTTARDPADRTGRREVAARAREERARRLAGERRRRRLVRGGALVALLAVAAVGVALWLAGRDDDGPPAGVRSYGYRGGDHTDGTVAYAEAPPVGGQHSPSTQPCGVYDAPVPNEPTVHTLEHGAVWVTYRPDLPAEGVAALRDRVAGEDDLLLSPYPDQTAPVVATAWNRQLDLDSATDERLDAFIAEYRNNPRTSPEAFVACASQTTEAGG